MIGCSGTGFTSGLAWCVLKTITIKNNFDDVLGDGFVGAGKCSLLGGIDLCVIDVCLVHEVLADGDDAIFKNIGLGKEPCVPCGSILDAGVHSEGVLDLLCIVKGAGGRTRNQEQMRDLGVDHGDDIVVR